LVHRNLPPTLLRSGRAYMGDYWGRRASSFTPLILKSEFPYMVFRTNSRNIILPNLPILEPPTCRRKRVMEASPAERATSTPNFIVWSRQLRPLSQLPQQLPLPSRQASQSQSIDSSSKQEKQQSWSSSRSDGTLLPPTASTSQDLKSLTPPDGSAPLPPPLKE